MEIELHGWKYSINSDAEDFDFKIEANSELPNTDSLYKYYSISKYSVDSFKRDLFYIAEPPDFNDEFDGARSRLDFNRISIDTCLKIINNPHSEDELRSQWLVNPEDVVERARYNYYKELITRIGVLCLTPNSLNELMWGYYSNNEGFCLEVETSKLPSNFKGPYPVNYVELKLIPFVQLGSAFSTITLLTTKKKIWKHEEEFRYIVAPSNNIGFKTKKPYHKNDNEKFADRLESCGDALKSITFGYRFMNAELKKDLVKLGDDGNFVVVFDTNVDGTKSLKCEIFETIIEKRIQCFNIIQQIEYEEDDPFKLKKEQWVIEKLDENKFKVIVTKENLLIHS